jgi:hypothetical protein
MCIKVPNDKLCDKSLQKGYYASDKVGKRRDIKIERVEARKG